MSDKIVLEKYIRNISDFPIPGIEFKDITPLLNHPSAFQMVIDIFADFVKKHKANTILAPEARGFIFGAAIAYKLGIKFVPVRKKGKLPFATYDVVYDLEYGSEILQIHQDALNANDRIVIIDDLVATSGTINACLQLINQSQSKTVGIASLITLEQFDEDNQFDNIPFLKIMKLK